MRKSAPVTFPARLLARMRARSATSDGWVNLPVEKPPWLATNAPSRAVLISTPMFLAAVAATPFSPSQSCVATGPGLMVLKRML